MFTPQYDNSRLFNSDLTRDNYFHFIYDFKLISYTSISLWQIQFTDNWDQSHYVPFRRAFSSGSKKSHKR